MTDKLLFVIARVVIVIARIMIHTHRLQGYQGTLDEHSKYLNELRDSI